MDILNLREKKPEAAWAKNVLYKISDSMEVVFEEWQEDTQTKDIVNLNYNLQEKQYGIYAHEFRNPLSNKNANNKAADILACVVDDDKKKVETWILDAKHNISSFDDDVTKNDEVLKALKDVKKFLDQIEMEYVHKESFMPLYRKEGYVEQMNVGIATSKFDSHKFIAVADYLTDLFEKKANASDLHWLVLRKNLAPYRGEIPRMRNFGNQVIQIMGKEYSLNVYLLKQNKNNNYETTIPLALA